MFFYILQQTEVSKSPMGLLVFRHYETVSKFSFFGPMCAVRSKYYVKLSNIGKIT